MNTYMYMYMLLHMYSTCTCMCTSTCGVSLGYGITIQGLILLRQSSKCVITMPDRTAFISAGLMLSCLGTVAYLNVCT